MSFVGQDGLQAIVCDFGTGTTKVGFAGSDAPNALFSTMVGVLPPGVAGTKGRNYSRGGTVYGFDVNPPQQYVTLKSPLNEGLVADWDMATAMLDYALVERCGLARPVGSSGAAAEPAAMEGGSSASSSSSSSSAASASGPASNRDAGSSSRGASKTAQPSASSSARGGVSLSDAKAATKRAVERGAASMAAHPFILAEHAYASKADREKWCEIAFEAYDCPGVFMSKSGVLVLYANARTTGLAIDMGAGGTQVTPVQEGYALMMGARVNPLGGRMLDEQLQATLRGRGVEVKPHLPQPPQLQVGAGASATAGLGAVDLSSGAGSDSRMAVDGRPGSSAPFGSAAAPAGSGSGAAPQWWHPSVLAFNVAEAMRDMKESLCRVSETSSEDQLAAGGPPSLASPGSAGPVAYQLPDGSTITVGGERLAVPELLFDPSPLAGSVPGATGLQNSILSSAMACDPELRRDLLGNMVLTGAASALPGVQERLMAEFAPMAPVGTRPKLAAASAGERALGPWLGGSIVGSLGGFTELWFARGEYAEHGAKMVHLKCP